MDCIEVSVMFVNAGRSRSALGPRFDHLQMLDFSRAEVKHDEVNESSTELFHDQKPNFVTLRRFMVVEAGLSWTAHQYG